MNQVFQGPAPGDRVGSDALRAYLVHARQETVARLVEQHVYNPADASTAGGAKASKWWMAFQVRLLFPSGGGVPRLLRRGCALPRGRARILAPVTERTPVGANGPRPSPLTTLAFLACRSAASWASSSARRPVPDGLGSRCRALGSLHRPSPRPIEADIHLVRRFSLAVNPTFSHCSPPFFLPCPQCISLRNTLPARTVAQKAKVGIDYRASRWWRSSRLISPLASASVRLQRVSERIARLDQTRQATRPAAPLSPSECTLVGVTAILSSLVRLTPPPPPRAAQ